MDVGQSTSGHGHTGSRGLCVKDTFNQSPALLPAWAPGITADPLHLTMSTLTKRGSLASREQLLHIYQVALCTPADVPESSVVSGTLCAPECVRDARQMLQRDCVLHLWSQLWCCEWGLGMCCYSLEKVSPKQSTPWVRLAPLSRWCCLWELRVVYGFGTLTS